MSKIGVFFKHYTLKIIVLHSVQIPLFYVQSSYEVHIHTSIILILLCLHSCLPFSPHHIRACVLCFVYMRINRNACNTLIECTHYREIFIFFYITLFNLKSI